MNKIRTVALFIVFILLSLYCLNRHKHIPIHTFRAEIWSDKAGYYIYLPATFLYGYSTAALPDSIEKLTGEGFSIKTGKIVTKYTYGVALLQLPFYMAADFLTYASDNPRDGISYFYNKAINIASVFYLVLALYLLYLSIKAHTNYSNRVIIGTLLILFFGTNLYYYSVMETGMSHVYSFFLFSCILYLLTNKPAFKFKHTYTLILSFLVCLTILVRPVNIILAIIPFTWNITSVNQLYSTARNNFKISTLLIWIVSFLVVFTPQFIYWKYAYGSFITYSYTNEGFSNLLSPKLTEVIFAPHNGLLPYSLIFPGILIGIGLQLKNNLFSGLRYLGIVLAVIYLSASWHDWGFGCAAGMRNMVEYYSLLSFPLCLFIHRVNSIDKTWMKTSAFLCIGFVVLICFRLNYYYFGCYFADTWDWTFYFDTLTYPHKLSKIIDLLQFTI